MKKTIILISILSTNLLWVSCKKNYENFKFNTQSKSSDSTIDASSIAPPVNYPTIHDYRTDARKSVAAALAKAMTIDEVRSFVKTLTTTKLLNETEFLYAQHYNDIIYNNKTLATVLDENSTQNDTFFNQDLLKYDPYLSILIPDDYEPENWNIYSSVPKVAATPSNWEDENEIYLPMYDTAGYSHSQSSNVQPENLTVVVAECEVITAFCLSYSGNTGNPYYSNDFYNYYINENCNINNGQEFILNSNGSSTALPDKKIVRRGCDRDNNTSKLDKLEKININGSTALAQMEGWAKGSVEIVYHVLYNNGTAQNPNWDSDEKVLPRISRKQAKNASAITLNITHFIWGNTNVMDNYKLLFGEREGNGGAPDPRNTNLTVTVNGVTISLTQAINWRRRDRQIGTQTIQFCTAANGNGTSFNTGLLSFNIII